MKQIDKIGRAILSSNGIHGSILRHFVDWYESVYGPVYALRHRKKSMIRGRSVIKGLGQIKKRWPDVQSDDQQSPVFILSAGWRSGSTLMQRLIMSKQSILVWGEPYSHARVIHHLADGVSSITESWPQDDWFIDQYDLKKLKTTFVANMYPSVADMQQGCLAYMNTMLEAPARQKGFERWGLKDVRLTIEDAHFLKWLYPNAKFIFLCRNPYNAYRSYRLDRSWYFEWPDKPVFTATEFGRNWNELTKGFYEGASDIGGIFIHYEDLVSNSVELGALEKYLELEIDTSLIGTKVGSHHKSKDALPSFEVKGLAKEVQQMADILDYEYI